MKVWEKCMALALAGTGKGGSPVLETPSGALGDFLSGIETPNKEGSLLRRSAAIAIWRRNGIRPRRLAPEARPAAGEETLPLAGASASAHLSMMLSGTYAAVLPEWLQEAARQGRRVPPELLPPLLEEVRKKRIPGKWVEPVAGQRGLWLAKVNPEWNSSSMGLDAALWDTGASAERIGLLRQFRDKDPDHARALVEQSWSQEPADLRKRFVDVFQESVQPADEVFLEKALDDKSKEVRRSAAEALARLPSSGLVRRMESRAESLFEFQPARLLAKAKVNFRIPGNVDEGMVRDGVETKAYTQSKKIGEKAAALMLILAAVPPEKWRKISGMEWDALVLAVSGSEWSLAVLSGWALAAERFRNPELAAALLTSGKDCGLVVDFDRLVRVLPEAERELWLDRMLEKKLIPFDSGKGMDPRVTATLGTFSGIWPEKTARLILRHLEARVRKDALDWSLAQVLPGYALSVPQNLIGPVCADWKPSEQNATSVGKFWEILRFRQDMIEALKS